jgi:phosphate starvation-inducible protein PhoH/intein/homing endonuclease
MKITLPERGLEALFGPYDQNIKYLESLLSVRVGGRGGELTIEGDEANVAVVERILKDYSQLFAEGRAPSDAELRSAFKEIAEDRTASLRELFTAQKRINPSGRKQVTARSPNQRRYLEAIEQHDIVFGIGPAGTGKCLKEDSLVLTSEGMMELGALGTSTQPFDHLPIELTIYGLAGAESASHIYNGGETDTLRITTRFGFSIEVTPEHPLLLLDEDGALKWRRADELRVGDALALQRGQRMFGQRTAVEFEYQPRSEQDRSSKPVHLDQLDAEFAYLMGALTGDGCLTQRNRILLSSADEFIVAALHRLAARWSLKVFPNGQHNYVIASAQLYQLLAHLGLSLNGAKTKRIPRSILAAPEKIVAAFLRGLFDTDGTIEKRDGLVSLSSISEALIRETQIVLLNFGIVATKSIKRGRYLGQPHVSHLLTMAGVEAERFHEFIGFGLERKRARRQTREFNPNLEVAPHLGTLISAAIRSTTFTHAEHKFFDDYRCERRRPSYAKLSAIFDRLDARGACGELLEQMRSLLDCHLLFAEITAIEPSRAQVYDLTVPGTHSFIANGFVNHNTYLAVAMAVQYLLAKQVNRIVLARPAVEAGEKLGFLPGDLQDKVDPYLRPLYDALFDLMDYERVTRFLEKRVIEIAPLAFMRGRTLGDSFIILDEAQNTTSEQMKMFLTRIGFGSKAVITGDVTQIDLPSGRKSGLVEAQRVVGGIEGISFIEFNEQDVVRHNLVQLIIRAYDEHNKKISI